MNKYDLSGKCITNLCCQIIRTQQLRTKRRDIPISFELSNGQGYESAIRQLSRDDRWTNDIKLILASDWYLHGVKRIANFHFLHGDLFGFYINRWNQQVALADTLGKLAVCSHALTIKFRYNYKRHECIHGGSHFIRELCNELEEHGCTMECGFAIGEPDRIPALRDQSIHFHMGLSLSLPLDQQKLDEHINHSIENMDSRDGNVVHVGPTQTSVLETSEGVRGWELYTAKSAQELGYSALSNVFVVTSTGLSAL
ncbi:MAG: hypothetical protein HON77_08025 [Gammaproteobacteria bacterium]|nr:hypothetical protein [Gammaproteobacteria bacterium]